MPDPGLHKHELLAKAQHLRSVASSAMDDQLREAALKLAEEYEQWVAEAERQDPADRD